ncbi:MAG: hypothetical protein BWK76_23110 [Desulfobulbaceae bacterium A2]|nr:MAG: hypothetical protein BWK76_23110 [Desulfobulbaceae bacterium A2]
MANKCCPEKVAFLITNQNVAFTEEDREFLEALSPVQMEKMIASINQVPVVNSAPAPATMDEVLTIAGPFADQIRAGLAALSAQREAVTLKITANARNTFTAEQLGGMTIEQLQGIAHLAGDVNYAPAAPAVNRASAPVPYVTPALFQ